MSERIKKAQYERQLEFVPDYVICEDGSRKRATSREWDLVRAILPNRQVHWLDGFLIFKTWRQRSQSSNYRSQFGIVVSKVPRQLKVVPNLGAVKLVHPVHPGRDDDVWRLDCHDRQLLGSNVAHAVRLADQSRDAFEEGNVALGWDLIRKSHKAWPDARILCQAVIRAPTLPDDTSKYAELLLELNKLALEHLDVLRSAIAKVAYLASKGRLGITPVIAGDRLEVWVFELLDVTQVIAMLSQGISKESLPTEHGEEQFVQHVNSLGQIFAEMHAGRLGKAINRRNRANTETSQLLSLLRGSELVIQAAEWVLRYSELLPHPRIRATDVNHSLRTAIIDFAEYETPLSSWGKVFGLFCSYLTTTVLAGRTTRTREKRRGPEDADIQAKRYQLLSLFAQYTSLNDARDDYRKIVQGLLTQQSDVPARSGRSRRSATPIGDVLVAARQYLKEDALRGLTERLRAGSPYVNLRLKEGILSDKPEYAKPDNASGREYHFVEDHGRLWHHVALEEIVASPRHYVLTAIAGAGKTAFLRSLQNAIMTRTDRLAVYLTAEEITMLRPLTWSGLTRYLVDKYEGRLNREGWKAALADAKKRSRLTLLVDGLDNLGSADIAYGKLANEILDTANDARVILAGRPLAVRALEERLEFNLLRLERFDLGQIRELFGEYYAPAIQMCARAPELLHIPVFACLVRMLAKRGETINVRSRWELYSTAITYLFDDHQYDRFGRNREQWIRRIGNTLARIAYESLDLKEPRFDEVPYDYCREPLREASLAIEDISCAGIVEIIHTRTGLGHPVARFWHRTFQEYFAAEWVRQHGDQINHVLTEHWNPKWREVLAFLAGSVGVELVERLRGRHLSDDCLHSRLFLAADCAGQTSVSPDLERSIYGDIADLLLARVRPPCRNRVLNTHSRALPVVQGLLCDFDGIYESQPLGTEAIRALINLRTGPSNEAAWGVILGVLDRGYLDVIIRLADALPTLCSEKRLSSLLALLFGGGLPSPTFHRDLEDFTALTTWMREDSLWARRSTAAAALLDAVAHRLNRGHIRRIFDVLTVDDEYQVALAIYILRKHGASLSPGQITSIAANLDSPSHRIGNAAAAAVADLSAYLNDDSMKIVLRWFNRVQCRDNLAPYMEYCAVAIARNIKEDMMLSFGRQLGSMDTLSRRKALLIFRSVNSELPAATVRQILNCLSDEAVCAEAIRTASTVRSYLSQQDVLRILKLITAPQPQVRCAVIRSLGQLLPGVADRCARDLIRRLFDCRDMDKTELIDACSHLASWLTKEERQYIIDAIMKETCHDSMSESFTETVRRFAPYLDREDHVYVIDKVTGIDSLKDGENMLIPILDGARLQAEDLQRLCPLLFDRDRKVRVLVYDMLRVSHGCGLLA